MPLVTHGLGFGGPLVTRGLTPSSEPPDPPLTSCGDDRMAAAMMWLTTQMQAHMAQPVIYDTGSGKIRVCATFGQKLYRLTDIDGSVRYERSDKDFLVPAASLVVDGVQFLPQRGHRIKVVQAGYTTVYEVDAPGGEAPWTWCDDYRQVLRIHGMMISEALA